MAWLAGYSKRKKITLTGGASGSQTDFQLKLTVVYDGDMQSDFDDLRFTQADGTTLIDAWLETKSDNVSATVWAEFPTTPANTVDADYYMYYGKAVANYWDIRATMLDGDDFSGVSLDAGIWDQQYCDAAVSGGELTLDNFVGTGGRYAGGILGKRLVGASAITEMRIKNVYTSDAGQFGLSNNAVFNTDDFNGILHNIDNTDAGWQYNEGALSHTGFVAFTSNVYYKYKIVHDGTDVHYYRDGTEKTNSPVSTNVPDEQMYMLISGDATYSSTLNVDWIFARKYAANPPTYAFGAEESAPTGAAPMGVLTGCFGRPFGGII